MPMPETRPRLPGRLVAAITLALIVAAGRPPAALAQPVNAEVMRSNPFKPGLAGGVNAKLSLSRGNTELLDVGLGARIEYQTLYPQEPALDGGAEHPADEAAPSADEPPYLDHRVLLTGDVRYAETDEGSTIDEGFIHLRWTWMWLKRVGSDVFLQGQYNDFQRLLSRSLAGAGPRVVIVHSWPLQVFGGSAYMLEYEHIDVEPGAPDDDHMTSHRWSNFLTVRVSGFDDRLLAKNTVFVQPRFDDFSDFRVLNELAVNARLDDIFSFGLSVSVRYDSEPPTGVKKTDLSLTNTIGAEF